MKTESVIKLPVRADSLSTDGEKRFVVNDSRGIVADCNNEQEAIYIARALNTQPHLLEACRAAEKAITDMWGSQCGGKNGAARDQLRAAITAAEKEKV